MKTLKKTIDLLKPLKNYIKYFQDDRIPASDVYDIFLNIPKVYNKLAEDKVISKKEKKIICDILKERFNFVYCDAHGICYLLDPRFLGVKMDDITKKNCEKF